MKKNLLTLIGALTVTGVVGAFTAAGQTEGGLDKLEKKRREIEERARAGQAVKDLGSKQGELQRNVERLQRKKGDLQRDMGYYKIRLERAIKELDNVQKMSPVDKELEGAAPADSGKGATAFAGSGQQPQGERKASNKQVKFITDLAAERKIPISDLNADIRKRFNVGGLYDLSAKQASALLDEMNGGGQRRRAA